MLWQRRIRDSSSTSWSVKGEYASNLWPIGRAIITALLSSSLLKSWTSQNFCSLLDIVPLLVSSAVSESVFFSSSPPTLSTRRQLVMSGKWIGPLDPRVFMKLFMKTENKMPQTKIAQVDFSSMAKKKESKMAASFVSPVLLSRNSC